MPSEPLPDHKAELLRLALSSSILTFGSYKLKSGRQSPYFFNCGLFSRAGLIRALSGAYAAALDGHARAQPGWGFDVLFGPAYKGIPLCATTAEKLGGIEGGRWGEVGYAFNRKEVKDHGEGGLIVGERLAGKRVVIIDDVMTAGTAVREAIDIIARQGGELVGIIVALDRQERQGGVSDGGSAVQEVRRETGVPVLAVLTLGDIIEGMRGMGREEEVRRMDEYRQRYGATE